MQAVLFKLVLAVPMFGSLDVNSSSLKQTQPYYHAGTYKTKPRKFCSFSFLENKNTVEIIDWMSFR